MEEEWRTYCLMSSIIFIEEMHKPKAGVQIKRYKNKKYYYTCYNSLELRMKDKEFLDKILKITRYWEKVKNKQFIGKSFNNVKIDNYSKQYKIIFTPTWLSNVMAECGKIPNLYSYRAAVKRINNIKQKHNEKIIPNSNKDLSKILLKNKKLAAGAFIISIDLECRGVQSGSISLCMSEPFKDFLKFMLKVTQKWEWTNNNSLSEVDMSYSRKLGINASNQYEFRISINGLKEIYSLAGPLIIKNKNKCAKFHIRRSNNYVNKGYHLIKNHTKQKIYEAVKNGNNMTTTQLQFIAGVRVDVILDHLHKLEKNGKVVKQRNGKRYIWNAV